MHRPLAALRAHRAAALLLLGGALLRGYLAAAHLPWLDGDEAIVGLMTRHLAFDGELPIFFYGQPYAGALVPYLAAPLFLLLGSSTAVLRGLMGALSLGFCVVVYLLARRLGGRRAGLFALALAAFAPPYFVIWSVSPKAQYLLTPLIGGAMLLLADDVAFRHRHRPRVWPRLFLLGLTMGLGFWVSIQALPFIAAAGLLVAVRRPRALLGAGGAALLAGLLLAQAPSLAFNLSAALREQGGVFGAPDWVTYTYAGKVSYRGPWRDLLDGLVTLPVTLAMILTVALPVMVGGASWEAEPSAARHAAVIVMLLFTVASLLWLAARRAGLLRRRRRLARVDPLLLQAGLVLGIFCVSSVRYEVMDEPKYLLPLFLLLPVAGGLFLARLRRRWRTAAAGIAAAVCLTGAAGGVWLSPSLDLTRAMWPPDEGLLDHLYARGIRTPITNYWLAYPIAFESDEEIIPIPIGLDRFSMYHADIRGRRPGGHYIYRRWRPGDPFYLYRLLPPLANGSSASAFARGLARRGVPPARVRAEALDHYTVFHVPREVLDPREIVGSYAGDLLAR